MTLQQVEFFGWLIALALEVVLIVRAWYFGVPLPLFLAFLSVDLRRSCLMFLANWNAEDYVRWWRITEVPDVALLAAAGLEAWSRVTRVKIPWWLYGAIVGGLILAGYAVPRSSETLPALLVPRTFAVSAIGVGLASAIGARQRCDVHAALMVAFVGIDVSAHLAVILGAPKYEPEAVMVVGQGACLLAWLLLVPRLAIGHRRA